ALDKVLVHTSSEEKGGLTEALKTLSGLVDEEGFSQVIKGLDANRGRLARMINRHGGLKNLLIATRSALGLSDDDDAENIAAKVLNDCDRDGLYRTAQALDEGAASDVDRAGVIRTWIEGDGDKGVFDNLYAPLFVTKKDEPRKTLITKSALKNYPEAETILVAEQGRVLAAKEKLKAISVVEASQAMLRLGTEMLRYYKYLKDAQAFLDYDDLIQHTRDLLKLDGGVSWVHYKLDGGMDHILVDEAQDTSPEQWEVIAALTEEFFSGEGASQSVRTVFAVGDEKQSIYSFQGADPDEFVRMREYFAERVKAAGRDWRPVELAQSYRSTLTVLNTVDDVFADDKARDGLTTDDTLRHIPFRIGQAGMVELWPTLKPEERPQASPWDAPLDQMPEDSPQSRLAERIAGRINEMCDTGEILESAGRPIRPGDIMILVRRRGSFTDEMVRCLKRLAIPVAGNDRMVLTEQLAVMDLAALGRFLLLPQGDLNLAVVLKGPFFGFDDDDLFDLCHQRNGGLWEELVKRNTENPQFHEAWLCLSELMAEADFRPPYDFFSGLLANRGGRRKLLARLGPDADDPIDEFLSLALHYERDHVPSMEGFLHWLEAGQTQIKRDLEQGRGEVRVMTVHGAKGLQSNIVFLPDTCTLPDPRHDPRILWTGGKEGDGETECLLWPAIRENEGAICGELRKVARLGIEREYRRLLYVALTRARDRLYIAGWETRKGLNEGCWYDMVKAAISDSEKSESITLWDDEKGWRLSNPQTVKPEEKTSAGKPVLKTKSLPSWAGRPPAPEPEPPAPLAPSRPTQDEPTIHSPFGSDDGARFKRGRLIHRLLQSLPDLAPDKRPVAAKAYLARPAHGLSKEERAEIAAETMKVLDDPDFALLFGPGSMAEVPITGVISNHVVSGQVDRLLVAKDAVTVIDYKTNRPAPESEDNVAPAYLRQMAAYRDILALIYPGREVKCLLLWTDGPRAMRLNDRMLAPYAP
ncbi:MAG: double-strand break repair helicase AddA, partial [Rhodospirillales bacterium]